MTHDPSLLSWSWLVLAVAHMRLTQQADLTVFGAPEGQQKGPASSTKHQICPPKDL